MAVIKHNSVVAASSGKVGGNIFSRNKSGVSVRCARSATQTQTSKSISRRNFLRQLGVLWRTSQSLIITNNQLPNPNFDSTPVYWFASNGDFEQLSGIGYFKGLTGFSVGYLIQSVILTHNDNAIISFKYLGSLSSGISSASFYIYDKIARITIFSKYVPDVLADFSFEIPFSLYKSDYQIGFRISGVDSIAAFEYANYFNRKNVFQLNWNQAAQDFPYSDRLGDTRTLTGQQLFTQLSLNLKELGLDPVISAPVPSLLAPLELLPGTGTSDSLVLYSNQFPLHSDCAVLIFATRTFPKSVTAWKPQEMKQIRPTPEITTSSINVFSQYVSIYGANSLIVGGHVFIKVSYFDKKTGQKINSVTQSINIV